MQIKALGPIETADQARQFAIDWQNWASEQSLSYAEVWEWSVYFKVLGKKFNLTDEFRDNGII